MDGETSNGDLNMPGVRNKWHSGYFYFPLYTGMQENQQLTAVPGGQSFVLFHPKMQKQTII